MNKDNMLADVTKISLKMKNKSLLSIEKNITEWEKILYYNYESILVWKIPLFYKGKYKKLFSFAPMFEKLSLNK